MRVESKTLRRQRAIMLLVAAWAISIAIASAQVSSSPSPTTNTAYVPTFTFDVASIRENKPSLSYTMSIVNPLHASTFRVTNVSAMDLIVVAYGIDRFQISGAPDWIHTVRFDIQAKSDPSVDQALAALTNGQASQEKRHMLQILLADRFNLKVHQETKDVQAFALVVLKSGPKFLETKPEPPESNGTKDPALYQRGDGARGYEFIAEGATMPSLAQALEGQFQIPVSDNTGLVGKYDFILQYHGTETDDSTDDGKIWPPLRRAIQEQLGLKLERTKAPVTIYVINHIEKPSEN